MLRHPVKVYTHLSGAVESHLFDLVRGFAPHHLRCLLYCGILLHKLLREAIGVNTPLRHLKDLTDIKISHLQQLPSAVVWAAL